MTARITLPGFRLDAPSPYRKKSQSDLGRAVINDEHLIALLDPAAPLVGGAPRNKAQPQGRTEVTAGTVTLGAFPNGSAAFDTYAGGEITVRPQIAFPKTEWSVLQVIDPQTPASGTAAYPAVFGGTGSGSDYAPRMGLNAGASAAKIYRGDTTERLGYTPGTAYLDNGPVCLLYTFSTDEGLKIYENNVLVAEDDTDKTPLTHGCDAGDWRMLHDTQGLSGVQIVYDIDLGKSAWAFRRTAIWDYADTFYGIS